MTERRRIAPGKLVELTIEASMVVFAVLLALGFEEWREERRMRSYAARTEEAVVAELEANLAELERTEDGLRTTAELLARVLEEEDLALLAGDQELSLPDVSRAAWEVARGSEAAPYFEHEWVITLARTYDLLELNARAAENVISAMSAMIGRDPTLDHVANIFGRLSVLIELQEQAQIRLREVLALSRSP